MTGAADEVERVEPFAGPLLDTTVWFPYYLPHWSSRVAAAACYELVDGALRLFIPPSHPRWCADTHAVPLRVSGIASGAFSGPVGSTIGQQSFAAGLTVRETQPRFEGWLVDGGYVEITCRMTLSPRSMAAMWLAGFEDAPEHSGEICVFEVFGKDITLGDNASPVAQVGMGHKQLGDPQLAHDFDAVPCAIDVTMTHTYGVRYDGDASVFTVDGVERKRCVGPPSYPMQFMIAVFDFPDWSAGADDHLVPDLIVDHVAVSPVP